ncbi:7-methylguanosine phosphate-specific 5'-nucleotidase-like isoform X1 [Erpetoichthys calabaricus]|uniref:7-methylguanosine phosphate-specific 5'-nucleotidase-like isoform X1 n=1 Tax=Erpetoichthys calabaricus TaxID=27687 RepID=UPI0022347777|nr:7-methylguanosine phosphate-specific 5'-nucleotidase-like isoform X1 [Erpetoichthys calabaricus]
MAITIWQHLGKYKVPELHNVSVHIRDRKKVEDTLECFRKGGPNRVQVISDFDMTLTRFAYNGTRVPTCHNIIDNSRLISEDGKKKLKDLLNTYYPIEIDPALTVEEKLPFMVEWWTKAHNFLVAEKIQKSQITQVVKESNVMLREGFDVFFRQLHKNGIPLFIFSAGIGDILEEVIRQAGVFYSNITVVSNYMDFDGNGLLQGFKGDLIHTYNKHEGALKNSGHFEKLNDQRNVILLGDSLGDLQMADGVENMENILKIGYLNDKVDKLRGQYLKGYDIVLEKDETLNVVNAILQYISAQN